MHKILALLLSAGAALATLPAHAGFTPPLGERPDVGGPRTQMLTLGSTHLSYHAEWTREWLAPLSARLVAWRPQLVTVESLSGAQCELMRMVPQRYAEAYEHSRARDAAWADIDGGEGVLAAYRAMNAPGAQDVQVQADFGGAFADESPERFGRHYAGW